LIERVRWGNVGRLVLVLAAGLLIALGPRACGSQTAPLPPDAAPPR